MFENLHLNRAPHTIEDDDIESTYFYLNCFKCNLLVSYNVSETISS